MPFSHVGVTVSHLPQACSFFLSALQPLGYRYIGKQGDQIGFGAEDADFFLSPSIPGTSPTTAHIAFSAPSRSAVCDFYNAALKAGGYPNGEPAPRGEDDCLFNAAVTDLDGNSIEVIYREDVAPTKIAYTMRSRVLTWTKRSNGSVVSGVSDNARSRVTARSSKSSLLSSAPSAAGSVARSKAPTLARSVSEASVVPTAIVSAQDPSSGLSTKTVIGTLLGAAAGAAVAYAMVRSERDSARDEAVYEAAMNGKTSQAASQPGKPQSFGDAKSTRSKKTHRNYSTTESQVPESLFERNRSVTSSEFYAAPRKSKSRLALEAAPEPIRFDQVDTDNYRSPDYITIAPTRFEHAPTSVAPSKALSRTSQQQVEYIPASSVSRRPSLASRRYQTAPPSVRGDALPLSRQIEDSPAAQARQTERDWAEEDMAVARRDSAMSDYSVQSSKLKPTQSHVSKHSSPSHAGSTRSHRSEHREPSEDRASHTSRVSRVSRSTKAKSTVSRDSSGNRSRRTRDDSRSRYSEYREPSRDRSTIVSQRSNRSYYAERDRDDSPGRESEASTIRPSRSTHSTAAEVPLPASRKTSVVSASELPLPMSRKTSVVSAAGLPLPMSRKSSYYSAAEYALPNSRKTSVVSGMVVPAPGSQRTSVASGMNVPLPASSVGSAGRVPLPQSRAGSIVGSILGRDHYRSSENTSAVDVPLPESRTGTGSYVGSILGRTSATGPQTAPQSRVDYAETVVPDDSISCVASRRHRERSPSESRSRSRSKESRHRSTKDSSHSKGSRRHRTHSKESRQRNRSRESKKSSSSKKHRHHRDEESLPPLPPSEVGSASTMTPGKYRKDSAVSLPLSIRSRSGIEKDEKRGKKSFMSAVMGH